MNIFTFKKAIKWATGIEVLLIIVSIGAIFSGGGHSGMMAFLFLHTPSSLLSVYLSDYAGKILSPVSMTLISISLPIIFQIFLMAIVLIGINFLIRYLRATILK